MVCHVVHRHLDRALIPRTTESPDDLLRAARDGRRAGLLQADDVAAEAEAEVARVVPGDLLGGDVDLVLKETSSGTDALKVKVNVSVFSAVENVPTGSSECAVIVLLKCCWSDGGCETLSRECGGQQGCQLCCRHRLWRREPWR